PAHRRYIQYLSGRASTQPFFRNRFTANFSRQQPYYLALRFAEGRPYFPRTYEQPRAEWTLPLRRPPGEDREASSRRSPPWRSDICRFVRFRESLRTKPPPEQLECARTVDSRAG